MWGRPWWHPRLGGLDFVLGQKFPTQRWDGIAGWDHSNWHPSLGECCGMSFIGLALVMHCQNPFVLRRWTGNTAKSPKDVPARLSGLGSTGPE